MLLQFHLINCKADENRGYLGLRSRPVVRWMEVEALASPCTSITKANHMAKHSISRRTLLSKIPIILGGTSLLTPQECLARNLPRSTGADRGQTGTVESLIPIVRIRQALKDGGSVSNLLYTLPRDEQAFKRLFDEYSDPVSYKQRFLDQNAFLVYYTRGFDGPNRPNIEEDIPERQTLQYGARNEAWVSWEALQVELQFAQEHPDDPNDVSLYLKQLVAAVDAYLELAPPEDVQQAMQKMK